METYIEPARKLPASSCDVIVAGGGTGGVIAAIASARQGAKTVLIEAKGYPGGIAVEGGTALHSYYNLWRAFPGVEKRQVVKGIPSELVDRLAEVGGTSGHGEMSVRYDYDSVCTAIDTEIYKRVAFEMLKEAGVRVLLNTFVVGAGAEDSSVKAAIVESRSGREAIFARAFVDCTGYGDLSAHAGARFSEPNDYPVANSIGVGGVCIDKYAEFLESHDAVRELAHGVRSGKPDQIVRVAGGGANSTLPAAFVKGAKAIGMATVTTTVHDDYFMFIKLNYKAPVSPTNRDAVVGAELELRQRQAKAIDLIREHVPGCERAFIARTSPTLCIRRGRLIECDYDITHEDVIEGRHFDDDIMAYGFHDMAPRLQIKDGGTYGIPYRALCVAGIDNLFATGMMITSDRRAHMSTRNTVSCMGQGQAAGIAAALCAAKVCGSRDLPYAELREALLAADVHLEN